MLERTALAQASAGRGRDRQRRNLSYEDISHYQKIVVALGETIRLMNERCLSEMF